MEFVQDDHRNSRQGGLSRQAPGQDPFGKVEHAGGWTGRFETHLVADGFPEVLPEFPGDVPGRPAGCQAPRAGTNVSIAGKV